MADLVKRAFASTDLYAILGVERTADAKALKKAYYRKALQFHPDKNPGDEDATAKFQALTLIHALLSDADRRAEYDESGLIDTEADEVSAEWEQYWRSLFPKFTTADIDHYASRYKGGDEEREDVLQAYVNCDGDMSKVLEFVPLCEPADLPRFCALIDAAIAADDVERLPGYEGTRVDPATAPKPPAASKGKRGKAKAASGGSGGDGESALAAAILGKQRAVSKRGREFDGMVEALASKYGAKGKGGSKGGQGRKKQRVAEEPSEEEFQRVQERMLARGGRRR